MTAPAVVEERRIAAVLASHGMVEVVTVNAIAAFVTQLTLLISLTIHAVSRFIGMSDIETSFAMNDGKTEVAILCVPGKICVIRILSIKHLQCRTGNGGAECAELPHEIVRPAQRQSELQSIPPVPPPAIKAIYG